MIKKTIRLITIACLAVTMMACHETKDNHLSPSLITNPKSAEQSNKEEALIEFDKTEFDFGRLLQGEVVSYTFHFTNVGNAPLIITGVDKSCGCTASEYPRQPIAPGNKGDIKITYDSKGHHGFQSKVLNVLSNTNPATTTLRIKAEVYTPDQL